MDYVNKAKKIIEIRKREIPGHEPYLEISAQLDYVEKVITGEEKDKSKLHKLTLGAYAAKEYEQTDGELSTALKEVYYIASQIGDGLKVKLPYE